VHLSLQRTRTMTNQKRYSLQSSSQLLAHAALSTTTSAAVQQQSIFFPHGRGEREGSGISNAGGGQTGSARGGLGLSISPTKSFYGSNGTGNANSQQQFGSPTNGARATPNLSRYVQAGSSPNGHGHLSNNFLAQVSSLAYTSGGTASENGLEASRNEREYSQSSVTRDGTTLRNDAAEQYRSHRKQLSASSPIAVPVSPTLVFNPSLHQGAPPTPSPISNGSGVFSAAFSAAGSSAGSHSSSGASSVEANSLRSSLTNALPLSNSGSGSAQSSPNQPVKTLQQHGTVTGISGPTLRRTTSDSSEEMLKNSRKRNSLIEKLPVPAPVRLEA
jgi:hypothetical protein